MRDYSMYKRGHTLEQYCRDEAVDFQWLTKAQKQYGETDESFRKKKVFKPARNKAADMPDLIKLHYEEGIPAEEEAMESETVSVAEREVIYGEGGNSRRSVTSLTLTTPSGDDIEIRSRKASAIAELLTQLAI